MKLKNYGIANFKAFGQPLQKIPIKPITLVFGPNSAGKSSLLHSLLWLNHAIKHDELNLRYPSAANGSIDLGGFSQVVNEQASPSRVIVELELDKSAIPTPLASALSIKNSVTIELAYGHHPWSRWHADISLVDFRIQIDGEDLIRASQRREYLKIVSCDFNRLSQKNDTTNDADPADVSEDSEFDDFLELTKNNLEKWSDEERADAIELLLQQALGNITLSGSLWMPNQLKIEPSESGNLNWASEIRLLNKLLKTIQNSIKSELCQMTHVPPLRELPARYFDVTGADEVWIKLSKSSLLLDKVNQWLGHSVFKTKYQIHVAEYFSRSVLDEKLAEFIRGEILCAAMPDPNSDAENPVSIDLIEVLEQLKDNYESSTPETILDSFPELKEDVLDSAADDYYFDEILKDDDQDDPSVDLTPEQYYQRSQKLPIKYTPEQIRRMSDRNVCLNDWVGREALDARDAYAITLFTKWAANQPQVLDVFNGTALVDSEISARDFLRQLAASKRDVRREIHLKDKDKGTTVSLQDVGVGVSQVLPVIINAFGKQNEFIAIEQPEIHIHPALQAELGDLFIESALGENKNTFLLETHSEHLILRLLRRIRETAEGDMEDWPEDLRKACPDGIRPEDVAVLYVEPGEEGARVIELPITPDGDFSRPWPGGFFGERSKELF
jgi:hypothetical protein